jgi:hypothetical protein
MRKIDHQMRNMAKTEFNLSKEVKTFYLLCTQMRKIDHQKRKVAKTEFSPRDKTFYLMQSNEYL